MLDFIQQQMASSIIACKKFNTTRASMISSTVSWLKHLSIVSILSQQRTEQSEAIKLKQHCEEERKSRKHRFTQIPCMTGM